MILRIEQVTAWAVMAVMAAALGGALSLPAPAHATEVAPDPAGQVVYVVGYRDNCDGSVEVAVANATPDSVTFTINGEDLSVEPMGIGDVAVWGDKGKAAKVTVKVKLGKGKPDKATHTWVKPALCVLPSASASASASPSTPPSSSPAPSTSTTPVAAQLPLTGLNVPAVTGLGVLTLVVGSGLIYGSRRRRQARHTVS